MTKIKQLESVFINCPFDADYLELRNALVFVIFDCGFIPRCALEEDNGSNGRFEKILRLIKESRLGVHDISRTEPDEKTNLPRFNMPLELGVFIGAKAFGDKVQQAKSCLIFDREPYRYKTFISDISGHDIHHHSFNPEELIKQTRNWLKSNSEKKIPGGKEIIRRFNLFKEDLPILCSKIPIAIDELGYNDYAELIELWLKENSPRDLNIRQR